MLDRQTCQKVETIGKGFATVGCGRKSRAGTGWSRRGAALTRQGGEDRNGDVRGEAGLWLAQTELPGVEDVIREADSADRSRNVREEFVFAPSQLPGDRAVDSLLSIVRDRKMQQSIREKALFWLVESDYDVAFEEIERLLSARE